MKFTSSALVLTLVLAATGFAQAARRKAIAAEKVAGGWHWRLSTSRGAIHVWRPLNFRPASGGMVVYVHGYFTDADGAWRDHHLAEQFASSRQNAMFIVPEAPAGDDQQVVWDKLGELISTAFSQLRLRPPPGPLVALGHSGAFRTIICWLDYPRLREIILLDGLYQGEQEFGSWISKRKTKRHMVLVASDTSQRTEQFIKPFSFAVSRVGLPDDFAGFTARERRARLLYVRSQIGHMELVTEGKLIPLVLRLSQLKITAKTAAGRTRTKRQEAK